MQPLPNFFIVGAPKAGTTSLYHYLDQHPQIYMSPIKEPNYFATEVRLEGFSEEFQKQVRKDVKALEKYLNGPMSRKRFGGLVTTWPDYLKLFQNVRDEEAIGEASVCYLWSESAPRNILSQLPGARIVMVLRDPAERAFSQYAQGVANGGIRDSFRAHVDKGIHGSGGRFNRAHPFLELGLYYAQVKRYLDLFPRERVHIAFYEEWQTDPSALITGVLGFLGVDDSFKPDMSRRHLAGRKPARSMEAGDRAYLRDYYREDVRQLAALLNRDLSGWVD
ncbi:MAG TPA: sulfotransferase [Bryobacteraceae bacterium]|nr:sulfotransferase [Bryobacteraceae bacterium]